MAVSLWNFGTFSAKIQATLLAQVLFALKPPHDYSAFDGHLCKQCHYDLNNWDNACECTQYCVDLPIRHRLYVRKYPVCGRQIRSFWEVCFSLFLV